MPIKIVYVVMQVPRPKPCGFLLISKICEGLLESDVGIINRDKQEFHNMWVPLQFGPSHN